MMFISYLGEKPPRWLDIAGLDTERLNQKYEDVAYASNKVCTVLTRIQQTFPKWDLQR